MVAIFHWLAIVAAVLAAYVLGDQGLERYASRAVAVDAKYTIEQHSEHSYFIVDWRNRRHCKFDQLVAMQGSANDSMHLKTPLILTYSNEVGSRGEGLLTNRDDPWKIDRPAALVGPDVIITAWHTCGTRAVGSRMIVVPIRDVFQSEEKTQ